MMLLYWPDHHYLFGDGKCAVNNVILLIRTFSIIGGYKLQDIFLNY